MTDRWAELTGRVVRPGDDDYPVASASWNLLFTYQPGAVVFAQETADVVNALAWARRHDVPFRVRSGRHCLEGWSSLDDGIVIDVSEMKSVTLDQAAGTVTVGAGLNQLEAVTALGKAGLAAPTGTEGTVGLVGATLGGGFGLLTRNFGMACDNLLAAEVVIASGTTGAVVVMADEENNPDLLWALRGAGNGNFGIVTALTYRVRPLAQTVYLTATWPGLEVLDRVFDAWQRSAPHVDNRLTSQLEIYRDRVVLIAVLAEGAEAEATDMLSPMLSVGEPEVSTTNAAWAENFAGFQIPTAQESANWRFTSHFVSDPFPVEAIGIIGAFLAKAPTPHCNYFTNAFGGAVKTAEPAAGSAFAHRDALFYAEPGAAWGVRGGLPAADDPLTGECLRWIAEFTEALRPYIDGAYVNVPNAGMPDFETAYWGAGVDRLRAVKAKYDPTNVFRFEQSIRPDPGTKP